MIGVKCSKKAAGQDSFVTCEVSQSRGLSPLPGCEGSAEWNKEEWQSGLLCKKCGKQFQPHYVYKGCVVENKERVLRILCREAASGTVKRVR